MPFTWKQVSIRGLICKPRLCTRAVSTRAKKAKAQKKDYHANRLDKEESKYEYKTRLAQVAWAEKAERIREGKEAHVWDILEERGYIKDVAGTRDGIRETMLQKRIGAYAGIDPTGPTLHIGHLVVLMPLFWMYMHGYTTLTVLGAATAKIGDPTGRLQSRDPMDHKTLVANLTGMHYQLKRMWTNVESIAEENGYVKEWAWRRGIENNSVWWNSQPMMEFLRLVGGTMRMGAMLSRDTVKTKLESGEGMSFSEFCYPLLQGWDFFQLYQKRGVQMQVGGSDQFGNIVAGIDVVKAARARQHPPPVPQPILDDVVGFTVPLLTDKAGNKFGKSAGNAVWLDAMETTPYDMYGYFVRRADDEVEKLLKLLTFVPTEKIREIMEEHTTDPPKRVAQHLLAFEVLRLVHGSDIAKSTQARHRSVYGRTADKASEHDEAEKVDDDSSYQPSLNAAPPPNMTLPRSLILGKSVAKVLYAARLADSISEGSRLARTQAVHIAGIPGQSTQADKKGRVFEQLQYAPVQLWFPENTANFLIDGELLILRKGKHNVRVIKVVSDEEWDKSGQVYPGQPNTGGVRVMRQRLEKLKTALKNLDDAEAGKNGSDEKSGDPAVSADTDLSEPPVERDDAQSALLIPTKTDKEKAELRRKIRHAVGVMKLRKEAAASGTTQGRGEQKSQQKVRGQLARELEAEEAPMASSARDNEGDVFDQNTGVDKPALKPWRRAQPTSLKDRPDQKMGVDKSALKPWRRAQSRPFKDGRDQKMGVDKPALKPWRRAQSRPLKNPWEGRGHRIKKQTRKDETRR